MSPTKSICFVQAFDLNRLEDRFFSWSLILPGGRIGSALSTGGLDVQAAISNLSQLRENTVKYMTCVLRHIVLREYIWGSIREALESEK